ncbi:MAG: tyrosine--tRNA ligase [Holophagales bacterium]|nr:tyrosine--tRNA ligase [Holophagales bacterium]MYD23195.1 tyrosine--tRNA ligase [Holophagales bacterium]MYI33791.1 tyrosine--tRNA ligase [Holophagales bacterium]
MSSGFPPVDEQMELLLRGAVDVVEEEALRQRLEQSRAEGRPLLVKTGFDPTAPDLHLGHAVLLRKMGHFQQLGHRVVFLVGDFTAMIGDPTGKKATRPQLKREQVLANAETYQEQAWQVLDRELTEIQHNSEWLGALGAEGLVRLAGSYTLARMMEREDFRDRFEKHEPISIHELLYPLTQGYDSVVMEADVELGGHDQLLNLLVGRDLMRARGMEPQIALTVPLLVGTDGTQKMSKSLGNAIAFEDSPREMFGRTMSIPDDLMWDWRLLLTDMDETELERQKADAASGRASPRDLKADLAHDLVRRFHGPGAADEARAEFDRMFRGGGVPDEIETRVVPSGQALFTLIADTGLTGSRAEARRLIQQGAVSLDGEKIGDPYFTLPDGANALLKVGKRRFLQVVAPAADAAD